MIWTGRKFSKKGKSQLLFWFVMRAPGNKLCACRKGEDETPGQCRETALGILGLLTNVPSVM